MLIIHLSPGVWASFTDGLGDTEFIAEVPDNTAIEDMEHEEVEALGDTVLPFHGPVAVPLSAITNLAKLAEFFVYQRYADLGPAERKAVGTAEEFDQVKRLVKMLAP